MRREYKIALLVAGLLGLPFAVVAWNALFAPNGDFVGPTGNYFGLDFVNFWSAGRLVLEGRVSEGYDPAAYKALLATWFAPAGMFTNLSYPPSLLPWLMAFAVLPYFVAYGLWQGLGVAAFVVAALGRWPRRHDLSSVAVLVLAPVVISNLVFGQIALFMAALFVGALRVLPARPVLAGVMFGFLTLKPQLALLVPVFLASVWAWRTLAAAGLTALALFGLSALLFGFAPWHAYLTDTAQLQWSYILSMSNFYAIHMTTPYAGLWTIGVPVKEALAGQWIASAAIVALTVLVARGEAAWPLKAAVLAFGSVLVVPYVLAHDLAVPFAALFWYLASEKAMPSRVDLALVGGLWLLPFPLTFILQKNGIPATEIALVLVYTGLVAKALGFGARRLSIGGDAMEAASH